jgi:putative flippase GtrA
MNRWLKFDLVGAIGMVVQLSTLSVLALWLHVHYLVATALAVELLSCTISCGIDTLRGRIVRPAGERNWTRLIQFNLTTGLVTITGNVLLMRFLVGLLELNYLLGNLLTIASCSIANFLIIDRLVFRRRVAVRAAMDSCPSPHDPVNSFTRRAS